MYVKGAICGSIRWSRTDIESIVFSAYKTHLQFLSNELTKRETFSYDGELLGLREEQQKIERSQKSKTSEAIRLYEEYRSGKISREQFIKKKTESNEQKKYETDRLESINRQIEELVAKRNAEIKRTDEIRRGIDVLSYSDEVLREKMYEAIEMITVYADREIEIKWKFGFDLSQWKEE